MFSCKKYSSLNNDGLTAIAIILRAFSAYMLQVQQLSFFQQELALSGFQLNIGYLTLKLIISLKFCFAKLYAIKKVSPMAHLYSMV